MPLVSRQRLKVVALVVGTLHAQELWTLHRLASASCDLQVVRAQRSSGVAKSKRIRRLLSDHGFCGTASRFLGARLIGAREARRQLRRLDQLFDGEHLREWWARNGISPIEVPHLNHAEARAQIAASQPDIIVRVSGGLLKPEIFSLARLVTLNIHHGQAPIIRGMWSIPWGIIEGRQEWIGSTVHVIDAGIDTGRILWRGSPQLSPGDTGELIFFRAHLEAVEALVRVVQKYAGGGTPTEWLPRDQEPSVYRSAPGLGAWLRYLILGRGQYAPVILERGLKC